MKPWQNETSTSHYSPLLYQCYLQLSSSTITFHVPKHSPCAAHPAAHIASSEIVFTTAVEFCQPNHLQLDLEGKPNPSDRKAMDHPGPCQWKEACAALWSLLYLSTAVPVEKPSPVACDKKSLPIKTSEDFTGALELFQIQTSKVIYMNWKVSKQNLQFPGLMLDEQCFVYFLPPSAGHNPAFSVSSPEIPGRCIWHPLSTGSLLKFLLYHCLSDWGTE